MKYKSIITLLLALGIFFPKAQVLMQALEAPDIEPVVPSGWSAEISSVRYLASVYDNDYYPLNSLDLTTQPATAQVGARASDGVNDPLLNYQGVIGTFSTTSSLHMPTKENAFEQRVYYAGTLKLNKTNASAPSINIPSVLATATIPARYIKNSNQDEIVYLNAWFTDGTSASMVQTSNTEIPVFISSDKRLELVQLDMNNGIGRDGKGILLTTFSLTGSNSKMELRLLPGIPDRFADTKTSGIWEHDMFYMPITASDGKSWLSNNLGAGYSQLIEHDFYPLQQAKQMNDYKAYGSLFQWQRKSDGHELMNWTNYDAGVAKYGTAQTLANSWTNAGTNKMIKGGADYTWFNLNLIEDHTDYWGVNGQNDPCPAGYHVPKNEEWDAIKNAYKTTYGNGTNRDAGRIWNGDVLKFSTPGFYARGEKLHRLVSTETSEATTPYWASGGYSFPYRYKGGDLNTCFPTDKPYDESCFYNAKIPRYAAMAFLGDDSQRDNPRRLWHIYNESQLLTSWVERISRGIRGPEVWTRTPNHRDMSSDNSGLQEIAVCEDWAPNGCRVLRDILARPVGQIVSLGTVYMDPAIVYLGGEPTGKPVTYDRRNWYLNAQGIYMYYSYGDPYDDYEFAITIYNNASYRLSNGQAVRCIKN